MWDWGRPSLPSSRLNCCSLLEGASHGFSGFSAASTLGSAPALAGAEDKPTCLSSPSVSSSGSPGTEHFFSGELASGAEEPFARDAAVM